MKTFVWISTGLMLIGLLSFSSTSLAEEGKWTKKADMPTGRSGLSTSAVRGKIYAIGGMRGATLPTVEGYDLELAGEAEGVEAKGKLATTWGKMKNR